MITLIEARNYRCLRSVSQPLGPFQLLVGPNATGKSTLLDVVNFLSRLTTDGLDAAVNERTSNIYDLFWRREGEGFELAVEVAIPQDKQKLLPSAYDIFRYEVAIELAPVTLEVAIAAERGFLKTCEPAILPGSARQMSAAEHSQSLVTEFRTAADFDDDSRRSQRLVLAKETTPAQNETTGTLKTHDSFFREDVAELNLPLPFRFGSRKAALANLPEDESMFPVATWFKQFLIKDSTLFQLDGQQLQDASPPAQREALHGNATNLPWVVATFKENHPAPFADWLAHLQTALPDLTDVDTVLREDDRHRYLMLQYGEGLRVPSWNVSEGTLRLIALTLPAYLPDFQGSLLIEEPENGLHPLAIETAYQSLSSVYDSQVLMATHSPLLVGLAKPSEVLCFTKDADGATQIVTGDKHPRLADWQGEVDLGTLFASGVLG